MITEGRRGRPSGVAVGDVGRDADGSRDNRVAREKGKKEKAIQAGGPGVGRCRVVGDVVEGVSLMRRVEEIELSLEGRPSLKERGGRESWNRRGDVSAIFNQVEVVTNEGGIVGVSGKHGADKLSVESKIATSFKINV